MITPVYYCGSFIPPVFADVRYILLVRVSEVHSSESRYCVNSMMKRQRPSAIMDADRPKFIRYSFVVRITEFQYLIVRQACRRCIFLQQYFTREYGSHNIRTVSVRCKTVCQGGEYFVKLYICAGYPVQQPVYVVRVVIYIIKNIVS